MVKAKVSSEGWGRNSALRVPPRNRSESNLFLHAWNSSRFPLEEEVSADKFFWENEQVIGKQIGIGFLYIIMDMHKKLP